MRLGIRQLELLRGVGTNSALATADKATRRLCELGLMREGVPGGLVHLTPKGLRVLADAVDAGRISLFDPPKKS